MAADLLSNRSGAFRIASGHLGRAASKTPLFIDPARDRNWPQGLHSIRRQETGSVIRKEDPTPGADSSEMVPFIFETVSLTM